MGKEIKDITIEEGFLRLSEIKEEMENSEVSLEKSFELYQEGVELIKVCNEKLDATEKKVKMISEDGKLVDFEE